MTTRHRSLKTHPKAFWGMVTALCSALSLSAQVQRDPAGVVVLTEAITPTQAAAALIQDSTAEGQIQFATGQTGTVRMITQGNRRLRYELMLPSRQMTSVVKDGVGYHLIGNQRKEYPLWVTAYQSLDHIPLLSRLTEYLNPNVKIIDLGTVRFAGRSCRQIRLSVVPEEANLTTIEDLMSELHVFIDTENKQIAGTRTFLFSPDAIENRSQVERVYSDYRVVNGVPMPLRVEQYISGRPDNVVTWNTIRVNTGVSEQVFN